MKNGDIIYFKEAKVSTALKAPIAQFKGHAFGILLGYVPPFQKDPTAGMAIRLLGEVGFISFDDIIELAGKQTCELLQKKFIEKYYGKLAQAEPVLPPPDQL